jgi:RNA polymerase sigma factor (sigma-70 family)
MHQTNWHDIYTQLSPKLLGICRRYIKDAATAEDIVQDSFIVAIQKESDLKNKDLLNGWLSRIVINKALNHLKYETKYLSTSMENIAFVDETIMTTPLELDLKSALLAADFTQNDLLEAIDSLTENHKAVFNLYIIDQFSHLEISKLLEISVGTSKSSLSRARKNIQAFLVEKLNLNKIEENKKRRILFLLFLGFGNQLFAQQFRKSFADFEIQPKNPLDLSRKVADSAIQFPLKSSNFVSYLPLGIIIVIASIMLILTFSEKEEIIPQQKQNLESKIVDNKAIIDSSEVETKKPKPTANQENSVLNKIAVSPKSTVSKVIVEQDTVTKKEPRKVVVIRKLIIKKDTIYVQK